MAAYPDRRNLTIKALGGSPPEIQPWLGGNWQLLPFSDDASDFLSALDFYVYFHSRRWVEAFGVSIAEAMASGVVTVLDPSYESLFEDGAVYTEASGVLGVIDRFLGVARGITRAIRSRPKLVERKFSLDTYHSG